MGTINNDKDIAKVAAALDDAYQRGLSEYHYRTSNAALARIASRLTRVKTVRDAMREMPDGREADRRQQERLERVRKLAHECSELLGDVTADLRGDS